MYLRLTAAAFSLGAALPLLTLFVLGELGARELPALGVAAIFIVVSGCAWLWAQHIGPEFISEPAPADLRTQHAAHQQDLTDESMSDK